MHQNVERVVAAAAAAGVAVEVSEFPDGTRTAQDAAAAVGTGVEQIVKSLIFRAVGGPDGDRLVLALVGGADRLDEARLAEAAGADHTERVDADAVRAATGYPIGGVPPFAHDTHLDAWIDTNLLRPDVVWAAAGTPRHVFPLSPADLQRLSGAHEAVLRVEQ